LDYGVDLDRPVEQVSWYEATNYCHQLTLRDRAAGRIPSGYAYRLPTEAEWEYACRAGTTNRFSYGDDLNYSELTEYAWYRDNSEGMTHAVGQKLPNPWGLYDVHGGVWEWCQDFWSDHFPGGSQIDPQGPATGPSQVMRGGCWSFPARHSRSAARLAVPPQGRLGDYGFRVVLAPSQP
jgi:formylglycine-generating enzyme required for sulfatase activity